MTTMLIRQAFTAGMMFPTYLGTMETLQRHMREQYEMLPIPVGAFDAFAARAAEKNVTRLLVLTEDFCPDSVLNLSIAARLVDAVRTISLRIVRRDDSWDIANEFPAADGYNHIPTLLFLTDDFSVAGVWHERPAAAHALVKKFVAENPEPPRETPTGERNRAFLHWRKKRLELQKTAYREGLWRESVQEWLACLA